MIRNYNLVAALMLLGSVPGAAQRTTTWKVLGDTTGAPAGCSAAAAINAINSWFAAFHAVDSTGLARAIGTSGRIPWVFSTGKFTPRDTFVRIEDLAALVRYARTRARQHEAMTLVAVHFWGWQGRTLGFMPYYDRSADDLGDEPIPGLGKFVYECGRGIFRMNMAPRRDMPIR